ncbi:S1C family serine protease [Microbacterium sp. GXF7504]
MTRGKVIVTRHLFHRRAVAAAAVASVAALTLTGCMFGGEQATSKAVGFEEVETATVYLKGQGTFIDPGTLDPAEGRWIGSGFLVSPDGLVVTNNHVVTGAGTLDAFVGGEEEVPAKVLGASECLDLAVVQLDAEDLPFFDWYDGDITTGLDVYSAGFPLGAAEEFTLTRGIVSKDDFSFDTAWASLDHVIEHDARIRGGNSGGPLIDAKGRLVGVNYAGNDSLDYNFAIHRDIAQDVLEKLASGEPVDSIGINAQAWGTEDGSLSGVWVSSVEAGGAADAAGIEPGDLIHKLAGVSVGTDGTLAEYCQVLRTQGSDATIDVEVYRPATDELLEGQVNGKELKVTASGVFGGSDTTTTGGFTTITDDAGVLRVSVPVEWGDVDGAGFDDGGTPWYALAAAPDIAAFADSYDATGLQLMASDRAGMSADAALSRFSIFDGVCAPTATGEPYDDGMYAGVYSEWECGDSLAYVISGLDADGNNVVVLLQLATQYDVDEALPEILNTFQAAF